MSEPTHISEIETIKNIYENGIQIIAKKLLPRHCFAREGQTIRPEALEDLKGLIMTLPQDHELTSEDICFHCSVQQTDYYEYCHGGQLSFKFH